MSNSCKYNDFSILISTLNTVLGKEQNLINIYSQTVENFKHRVNEHTVSANIKDNTIKYKI